MPVEASIQLLYTGRSRAVAEYLNVWLTTDGRVLHNVPLDAGTADHVLICCKGVYVIETKTRTLPRRGAPVVHVSDSGLRVGGYTPDRDPLAQIGRYVKSLKRMLAGGTGVTGIVKRRAVTRESRLRMGLISLNISDIGPDVLK